MLKVETICKRAYYSADDNIRHQARELMFMLSDKYRSNNERVIADAWTTEEYREYLESHGIEYVEILIEKDNNKNIHIIIPSLIFKNMSSADIGKLIKN